jgi:hypothetical protein
MYLSEWYIGNSEMIQSCGCCCCFVVSAEWCYVLGTFIVLIFVLTHRSATVSGMQWKISITILVNTSLCNSLVCDLHKLKKKAGAHFKHFLRKKEKRHVQESGIIKEKWWGTKQEILFRCYRGVPAKWLTNQCFLEPLSLFWLSGLTNTDNVLCQVINFVPSSNVTCCWTQLIVCCLPQFQKFQKVKQEIGTNLISLDGIWGHHTTFASKWFKQIDG